MPEISIDAHEVRELAADFTKVPGELARWTVPVLKKGAQNIKEQIAESFEASSNAGFRYVGRTVSYDLTTEGSEYSAEIGPDKDRGGALANVAIFGTPRGGGTVADPREALEAEAPRFEKALADLAEELFG